MDYNRLLNRAWTIIWTHKFLIWLGVLAALGGGGGGNNIRWQINESNGSGTPIFNFDESTFAGFPIALLIFIISLALALGLGLWVIATLARGSLIAAVDTIDSGGQATFMTAWEASWQKGWSLLGIALLPAIPILILLVVGLVMTGALASFALLFRGDLDFPLRAGLGSLMIALACIAAPLALVLTLLRNFAERACILENLGVLAAYRRGWAVLMHNLGPAIILFLIQIALTILLGISMIGPGIVMVLCFLLWPVLLLIGGTVAAYFSALWTLAWREWTAGSINSLRTASVTGIGKG